ncbi:MAG: transglycosylase domain-containing protein [Bacteroidota bacterium]
MNKLREILTPEPKHRRKLKILWIAFATPFAFILIMLLGALLSDLPSLEELENPKSNQATEIISSDGQVLGQYFKENRVNVDYKELSPHLVNALVATEDERFYEHSGIDIKALFRVVKGVVTANSSQGGGSTISQQLAKMLFTEKPESAWARVKQKFREWIISVRLERRYTKEEIVAMYLNRYDFVNHAVGIKSAAYVYFNTTPDKLTLEQSAMLIGMAKNASYYNPNKRPAESKVRRNVVLAQMRKNNFLTEEECTAAQEKPLNLDFHVVDHNEGAAPYFREVLRTDVQELLSEKDGIGNYKYLNPETNQPYNIYKDGLKIYTTIDSRMQGYAEYAVEEHMAGFNQPEFVKDLKNKKNAPFDFRVTTEEIEKIMNIAVYRSDRYIQALDEFTNGGEGGKRSKEEIERFRKVEIPKIFSKKVKMKVFTYAGDRDTVMSPMDSIRYYKSFLQTGFVAMEPKTGYVKAWVGGINYKHFKYDHVKQGSNQVGSTFKPFVYATAIREGLNPCEQVPNQIVCFDMPGDQPMYCPKNSDGKYGGVVTVKQGLARSLNTVTAYIMKRYGPEAVITLAKDLGITAKMKAVPSLALGVADINLMEMVAANAAFANKGVYIKPVVVTRIEDKNGKVIYSNVPVTKEALDEQTAYVTLDLMKGVCNYGTGARIRYDRPYGRITAPVAGKTGTTQSNSDGWFIGITPDLVAGCWVGGEDRAIRFSRTQLGQGASSALPIWGYFMNKVYADKTINLSKADFQRPAHLTIDLNCAEVILQGEYDEAGQGESFDDTQIPALPKGDDDEFDK